MKGFLAARYSRMPSVFSLSSLSFGHSAPIREMLVLDGLRLARYDSGSGRLSKPAAGLKGNIHY
jgi:hypothetical protein